MWICIFRPTPRIFHNWRVMLLRLFGAKMAQGTKVFPSARIWAPWNLRMEEFSTLSDYVDCYCVATVTIGAFATVSQRAFLCTATHDVCDPNMRLLTAPVVVANQAWVCAGAFIGPGVTISEGSVVGAMAVVTKDVAPWTIVAGNPSREIRKRALRSRSHNADS